MVILPPSRRALLAGLGALACVPRAAFAEDIIDLKWRDLVAEGETPVPPSVQGLFGHDETDGLMSEQPPSNGVRTDWNGLVVSLPGFIVPIDYSGTGVTAFILVPYVGACVHVPPSKPYENSGLFEAVTVVGMFGTASTSTQLADISYALSADLIVPYRA
jgi:hypothetical protein